MAEAAEQVAGNHTETSEVAMQTTFPGQTTEEAAVQAVGPFRESAVQAVLPSQELATIIEKEREINNCREVNSVLVKRIHEMDNESKVKDELAKTNIVQINSLEEENKSFRKKLIIYGATIKELDKELRATRNLE